MTQQSYNISEEPNHGDGAAYTFQEGKYLPQTWAQTSPTVRNSVLQLHFTTLKYIVAVNNRPYSNSIIWDHHFVLFSGTEGGKHWSDKEIRALFNVWSDREIQGRLQTTHRNKAIFQEMSRRLEVKHGVVRDWRQCRTKYKNFKYDYKVSKSQGRSMRFFTEVDTILQGKVTEDELDEDEDSPRRRPEGDQAYGRVESGEHHYINIDDGERLNLSQVFKGLLLVLVFKFPQTPMFSYSVPLFFFLSDESLADMQTIIKTGSHLISKDLHVSQGKNVL